MDDNQLHPEIARQEGMMQEPQRIYDVHPSLQPELDAPLEVEPQPEPQEVVEQESEPAPEPVLDKQPEPVQDVKDRDWRAIRAQAEEAKQMKREAEAIARERDFYREQALKAKQHQEPQVDDYRTDTERELAREMAEIKNEVRKQQEETRKAQQQATIARAEQRLYTDYPDIKEVVSDDNIKRLEFEFPNLYNSVIASSDVYTVGSAAYEMIIAKGIYKKPVSVLNSITQNNTINRNQAKPKSVSTIAPQAGETPIKQANSYMSNHEATEAERKALYAEMVNSSRNRAF